MAEQPLLERDGERDRLRSAADEAAAGGGCCVLIEGAAGIGKTRLLAALTAYAADRGFTTLTARGGELEREFPFGVARQLFEPLASDPALVTGAAAPAAALFEPPAEGAEDPSFAVLHGLFWLAANASAGAPLLLAIDDLHWCDRASLRFAAYLARRVDGLPILLAAAARPDGDELLASLVSDPGVSALRPAPLSSAAVRELVRAELGATADEKFCHACEAATGGNPLLLREVLRALAAESIAPDAANAAAVRDLGGRAVSRAVLLRVARLSGEAVAVARAVAVLGDGAAVGTIAALAGVDEPSAARATGALAAAEILRRDPPLGFVHPVVRDAVYHDIAPGERELLHDRAARLLAGSGAEPERVSAHVLALPARGEGWAASVLREAASAALARGAPDSAVAYLRRARDETAPPAAVLAELGRAEALTSGPAAAESLRAALEAETDPVRRGELAVVLGRVLLYAGRRAGAEVVALSERCAAALGPGELDLRQRLEANALNAAHFDPALMPDLEERLRGYRSCIEGDGPGAAALAVGAAHDWMRRGGPAGECARLARRALAGRAVLDTDAGAGAVVGAIVVLALADDDAAVNVCARALAAAHARGSLLLAAGAYVFTGLTRLLRGEVEEAEAAVRSGFDSLELWGLARAPSPAAFLAEALIERGELAAAEAALERAGLPAEPPADAQLNWWFAARGRLLLARGEVDDALALTADCEQRFAEEPPAWMPWRSLRAAALDRAGRADEAAQLAAAEVELAREFGAPRTLGRALRVLGSIQRADGVAALREAVDVLDRSPARLELAKALVALGAVLRRGGEARAAREPLARALELATACGAKATADVARAELHASGARPRTTALAGVESLTPSERRVAELAAAGRSNREIAQELYVVPRTVEIHLSNAYRKLAIRSRRELPEALGA